MSINHEAAKCLAEYWAQITTSPEPQMMGRAYLDLLAQLEAAKKDAGRYRYWRDCGIAISDAPVSYLFDEELDSFTDKALKSDKRLRQSCKE